MRFSEAEGHKVVSTSTAETVGRIDRFVVDAPGRRVAALLLKKTSAGGDMLPWAAIAAFGVDAVTVGDASAVVTADEHLAELADKRHTLQGKRVLSQLGVDLGVVKDVDFDPADGTVRAILTDREELTGERLVAAGSYAVVVSDS